MRVGNLRLIETEIWLHMSEKVTVSHSHERKMPMYYCKIATKLTTIIGGKQQQDREDQIM